MVYTLIALAVAMAKISGTSVRGAGRVA